MKIKQVGKATFNVDAIVDMGYDKFAEAYQPMVDKRWIDMDIKSLWREITGKTVPNGSAKKNQSVGSTE